MKFIMFLRMPGGEPVSADLRSEIGREMDRWENTLSRKGVLESVSPLHGVKHAAVFNQKGEADSVSASIAENAIVACICIAVENIEEAHSIASACPHLMCGDVELRQVHDT